MDDAMPFPGHDPGHDDDDEEKPKLPPEVQKLMDMIGGTAIPIGKERAMAFLDELKFERVIIGALNSMSNTGFYLKNKRMPASDEEHEQFYAQHVVQSVTYEAMNEFFHEALKAQGYGKDAGEETDAFLDRAAATLSMAYTLGVMMQGSTNAFKVIETVRDNKSVQEKLRARINELVQKNRKSKDESDEEDGKPPAQPHIAMTREKLEDLKLKYAAAMRDGKLVFSFDGRDMDTSYAKYAIEYCESEFAKKGGES